MKLKPDETIQVYRTLIEPLFRIQSSPALFVTALDLHRYDLLSWRDALIVSAAIHGGCDRLLTEDLQDGAGIQVRNPFT